MLYVVIGKRAVELDFEKVMAVYPEHKAFYESFVKSKEAVAAGPFKDEMGGNMAIFNTLAAAQNFSKNDPFLREGLIEKYEIKQWEAII